MRQVAVIGLGKFGSTVARELTDLGAHVIAIDTDRERVEELKDRVTYAVTLNATDEKALRAIGIQDVDVAVVTVGEDVEANLLTTVLLKRMGVKRIWARAISPMQQEILKALEVDSIINLETEMGKLVARSLVTENVVKHVHLGPGYSVAEIRIPPQFVGKSIRQTQARKQFNVNVVAIKKRKPQITETGERTFEEYSESIPSPDQELEEEDVLVVVGREEDVTRFSRGS